MRKLRTGILGGSFNPPHLGHLFAAVYALKVFPVDEIWMVPAFRHAFNKELQSFEKRKRMLEILIRGFERKIRISTIEKDLKSDGKMFNTLQALSKKYPRRKFSLIIGTDLLVELKTWYQAENLQRKFSVYAVPRGKQNTTRFEIPNISSRKIRKGKRNNEALALGLLPEIAEIWENA